MEEIFDLGGINWSWFIHVVVNEETSTIEILKYYRLHKGDEWPEENKRALYHPQYHSMNQIDEDENRVVRRFNHPTWGWLEVSNPKYVFDYK